MCVASISLRSKRCFGYQSQEYLVRDHRSKILVSLGISRIPRARVYFVGCCAFVCYLSILLSVVESRKVIPVAH